MPRPHHTHLTQAEQPVAGCPACALIRPEVMNRAAIPYLRRPDVNVFGTPPRP